MRTRGLRHACSHRCSAAALQPDSVSLSPPVALLDMGLALPNVVNLRYVTPEVFVREVRACGVTRGVSSTLGGRLGPVTWGSPLSLPPC